MATVERVEPWPLRWTREEYYRVAETGVFEGRHVELLRGEIFEMSPRGSERAAVVTHVDKLLSRIVEPLGYCVRAQCPLDLEVNSEPEPDLAVVRGKLIDYRHAHPKTAALIIEVADTTLRADRTRKGSLYAAAGIADYWILNLVDRQLEVYRDPVPDAEQLYGHGYATVTILKAGASASLLALPGPVIAVADLLPG